MIDLRINIFLGNHYPEWILDQIWFLKKALIHKKISLQFSNKLVPDALNLIIENFEPPLIQKILDFCKKYNKKIGVVLTEHIDFVNGIINFNGIQVAESDDYQPRKLLRLLGLLNLAPVTIGYFTLGDYPRLINFDKIIYTANIIRIPYPMIEEKDMFLQIKNKPEYDFVFTGTLTDHRKKIINYIENSSKIFNCTFGNKETTRAKLLHESRYSLNIPQRSTWKWLSPMRILFGFRSGKATIHIGSAEKCKISKCIEYLPKLDKQYILNFLKNDSTILFEQNLDKYQSFVCSKENYFFPISEFENWAEVDQIIL
ncbi:MAG: hypothetical protein GY710_18095 [Desulfobacteraceae bacterium]|nr:hypothetical protein [Desulfobacteraceae bacterium]